MREQETKQTNHFDQEEKQLRSLKKTFTELPIPTDRLDEAIIAGIKQGKQQQTKGLMWKRSSLVAALLLILFTSFIRVSDTFAAYVTQIPGMEKFVELVRYDKGLSDAIEHEYMQSYEGLTAEHDGLKVTIDSFIVDEKQMFVFYTLESTADHQHVRTDSVQLTDADGNDVLAAISYGGEQENLQEVKEPILNRMDFLFNEPLDVDELHLTLRFKEGNWEGKVLDGEWNITLPIDQVKIAKKKVFHVNQEVEVEGQKITVKQVTIFPTRVAVLLTYDPNNTKEIFEIEDIRLVNERGESRTIIADGATISHVGEHEREFFLQSNYFNEPEELYLRFNNIRALDKKELQVIVDPEQSTIIQAPADGLLKEFRREGGELVFRFQMNKRQKHLMMPALVYEGKDSLSHVETAQEDDESQTVYIPFSPKKHGSGPVTLILKDYPARIHGDVEIKLK